MYQPSSATPSTLPLLTAMSELGMFFKATLTSCTMAQTGCLPGWGHTASGKGLSVGTMLLTVESPPIVPTPIFQ